MQESPFRFFRGSCHLFYEDFACNRPWDDPTKVWICGDLHLENYGSYKAGNGQVYFDVVDFDEAVLAPATWEVARTLSSIFLAASSMGMALKAAEELAMKFFKTYNDVILSGKPVAFERNTARGLMKHFIRSVEKRKSKDLISERTMIRDDETCLKIIEGKTVKLEPEKKKAIINLLSVWAKTHEHRNWKICDAAYRIAGTGSLGLERYVILIKDTELKKYFLLDMKESIPSCLQPFVGIAQPDWKNRATRVVTIQNFMQNVSSQILEIIVDGEKQFVLKKLQPQADMMNLKLCNGKLQKLQEVIEAFAEISASAHLRATGRFGSNTVDELITFFRTSETWRPIILKYSKKYAAQVKKDHMAFCKQK